MIRRPGLRPLRRGWVVVIVLALLAAVAGVVAWRLVRDDDGTRLTQALQRAPESSVRFSWTDWAAVRDEVGVSVSSASTGDEVDEFMNAAYDRDLTSGTALGESAPTIQTELGFSPATLDWELFAQGPDGAVVVMGLAEDTDLEAIRDRLRSAGFKKPDDADGAWLGGSDVLERLSGPVTPELGFLQIDEEARILYGSDDGAFLLERADVERGEQDDDVVRAAAAAGPAVAASVFAGEYACSELSMGQADPAERTRAAELLNQAGEVHPLTGFAIAAQPGGDVRVAFVLDSEDQARTDADTRSRLAAGPAPGQGGTFPERFTLGKVAAQERVVTMELSPVEDWLVLSDLNSGPVLFATC